MAEYDMRPLSLGEQLDRAFAVYRERFGALFLSTFAGLMVPLILMANSLKRFADLGALMQGGTRPDALMGPIMAMAGKVATIAIAALVGFAVVRAALAWIAHKALLGDKVDVFEAMEKGVRFMPAMIGLSIVEAAIYLVGAGILYVPAVLLLLGGVAAGGAGAGSIGGFLVVMLAIIVLMFYLVSGFFVTAAVLVCETDATVFKALGRSWELTKGGRWPILGGMLAIGVVSFIMQIILAIAFGAFTGYRARAGGMADPGPMMLASFALNCVVSILVTAFFYVFQMVTYYDLRIRKEGLDIELTAERQTPK